jgi:serine/threonine-protein kinase HipA
MSIKVKIWNQTVGIIGWSDQHNCAAFKYDKEYLNNGHSLSPYHLPLSEKVFIFPNLEPQTFKGLPGVFADSLPDRFGEALVNAHFEKKGISFGNLKALDRLAYVGKRGMGAIEYEPAEEIKVSDNELNIELLEQLADFGLKKASRLHSSLEVDSAIQDILSIGTSAGGARPKAVIALNSKTGEIKSGQLEHGIDFEHWLIKLDISSNVDLLGDPQGYGRIEYSYYEMAKEAGVNMSECRLYEENSRGHFMTKRFDRVGQDKIHTHSLCGFAHINYTQIEQHSYEQIFAAARGLKLPYSDKEEIYRRMVFNVLARNCDDHTKNFGFQMDPTGRWSITPAYDICYSYDPLNVWVNGNMRVNGKRRDITFKDLIKEADQQGIKGSRMIIEQVAQGVAKWDMIAAKNKVKTSIRKAIQIELNLANKELGLHKFDELRGRKI